MPDLKWIVVSFYTVRTSYEKEIKKLEASLKRFNIDYHFFACEPTGTWRGNLNHKSAIILKSFDLFPDKDIVFLDSDAIVRAWPVLFDGLSKQREYDLSAHFYRYRPQSGDREELLSGTLWFQNSQVSRDVVKRWDEIGRRRPDQRHQMCLKMAIAELTAEGYLVRVFHHPFEYTCIFDYHAARNGKQPIIEHFQASRRFRNEVGFGTQLIPGALSLADRHRRARRMIQIARPGASKAEK